jgi:transaldolase
MDSQANPLRALEGLGQSVWIDFIRRGMLSSGELQRLVDGDGVSGVTSNPAIFEKAIADSNDYDEAIARLARAGCSTPDILRAVTVDDIQRTADVLAPTFDREGGRDGFVSLEVSPFLARDTDGTIAEAHALWAAVRRPNVMIKVPGTREGLPAIQRLLADGINVNITLLFGLPRYREVVEAWLSGLEARASRGGDLTKISSVASFFLSRIDVLLDPVLGKREGGDELVGQVAIASAKVAYQMWKDLVAGPRFQRLASQGARAQRLLWASTGTKDPAASDVLYVEALAAELTINTMPDTTLLAFADHGHVRGLLRDDGGDVDETLARFTQAGIDLDALALRLQQEGAAAFSASWAKLLDCIARKRDLLAA